MLRAGTFLLLLAAALATVAGQQVNKTLITDGSVLPASRPPMWPGMRQGPSQASSVKCEKVGGP